MQGSGKNSRGNTRKNGRQEKWKKWFETRIGKRKVYRNTKDRLFRFIFEKDKGALLQLYNALNDTDYQDESQLQIVTIESAVYIVMKNDLAYVLAGTLNMYEHQSTYNPNLPVRFLIYLAQEYQKMIEEVGMSLYGTKQIVLPTPQCVVFYNGEKEVPDEQILRLSDAFENKASKADVELTVRMLNINYGHNRELMERCKILEEYAKFVEISREFAKQDRDRKLALNKAIDYCIENKILKEFLRKYRAEVLGMLLEEFDEEKFRRTMREEGRWQATIEILQEMNQSKEFVKAKLLEKYALSERDVEELLRQFWKE